MWKNNIHLASMVLRSILGLVFAISSLPKIQYPFQFLSNLLAYEIVRGDFAVLVAATIPWVELILSIFLLAGVFPLGATFLSAVLFAVFSYFQFHALSNSLDISCGCFGNILDAASDQVNYSSFFST